MASEVKSKGRIYYVEPNRFDENVILDKNGKKISSTILPDNMIAHDYENYNIMVDFLIETRSKNNYNLNESSDVKKVFNEKHYAHFIGGHADQGGTTWYLSTDYSDLSARNLMTGGNTESIGITNITIDFKSWGMPIVQMDFVDVRGASFMISNEYAYKTQLYYDSKTGGNGRKMDVTTGSFFSSLLSFPPPIFYLRVKGFYGGGVTFKLCLTKTDIEFDGDRGNFKIKCNFIGYQYGILTDIPFMYCYVAPKTQEGLEIWNKNNYTFTFKNNDKLQVEPVKIPLIDEYVNKVKTFENHVAEIFSNCNELTEYQELTGKQSALDKIINMYPFDGFYFKYVEDYGYVGLYILENEDINTKIYNKMLERITKFNNLVKKYNDNYDNSLSRLEKLKTITARKTKNGKLVSDCIFHYKVENGKPIITDKEVDFNEKLTVYLATSALEAAKTHKNGFNMHLIVFETYSNYKDILIKTEHELDSVIKERAIKAEESSNDIVTQNLGFAPSIKNITEITLAHYETFILLLMSCLNKINEDAIGKRRTAKKFVNDITDTDMNMTSDSQMPPFTLFTNEFNVDGTVKRVAIFPTEYNKNLSSLPEVQLVYSILSAAGTNGVKPCPEIGYNYSIYSSLDEVGDNTISDPIIGGINDVIHYYPVTQYDIANGGDNPYDFIRTDVLLEEVGNWVYSTFMSRDLYVENTIYRDADNLEECAKTFGAIEAINMYTSLKEKYSYEDLTKYGLLDKKAYKMNCNSRDNFFRMISGNGMTKWRYGWLKDNSDNLYMPIDRYDEESIYRYNQYSGKEDAIQSHFYNFIDLNQNVRTYSFCDIDIIESVNGEFAKINAQDSGDVNITIDNLFRFEKIEKKPIYPGRIFGEEKDIIFGEMSKNRDYTLTNQFSRIIDVDKYEIINSGTTIIDSNEDGCPIFNCSLYYKQESLAAKAYLFLMSLVSNNDDSFANGFGATTVRTKSDLLTEGAFYWRLDTYNETLVDPINFSGNTIICGPNLIPRMKCNDGSYCLAATRFGVGIEANPTCTFNNALRKDELKSYFLQFVSDTYSKIDNDFSLRLSNGDCVNANSFDSQIFTTVDLSTNNDLYYFANSILTKTKKSGEYYISGDDIRIRLSNEYAGCDMIPENKESLDLVKEILTTKMYCYDSVCDVNGDLITEKDALKCGNVEFRDVAFNEFIKSIKRLYNISTSEQTENNGDRSKKGEKNPDDYGNMDTTKSNDVRLIVYLELKNIYEKWLCSSSASDWIYFSKEEQSNGVEIHTPSKNCQFKFEYIDSFHNDIGNKLMLNIEGTAAKFKMMAEGSNSGEVDNRSLYSVFGDIAEKSHSTLMSLPFMFGQTYDEKELRSLFDTKRLDDIDFNDKTSFIFMYAYAPSKSLDRKKCGEFPNDSFDIADTLGEVSFMLPSDIASVPANTDKDEIIYKIPAFGVTYGMQSQSYFTKIQLDGKAPNGGANEWVIKSLANIASKSSESQVKNVSQGQNLYKIFSDYSYRCTVDMLGDVMISPLMYFQLNNVPMWKGAYQIFSVKHTISPGRVMTTFSGYRLSKNAVKFVEPLPISSVLRDYEKVGIKSGNKTTTTNTSGNTTTGPSVEKPKSKTGNNSEKEKVYDFIFKDMMPNVKIWGGGGQADTNGNANGIYFSHLYSYMIAYLLDNESSVDFEAYKNKMVVDGKLAPVVDGRPWIESSTTNFGLNTVGQVAFSKYLQKKLTKRKIVVSLNMSFMTLDTIKTVLNNKSNFADGDLVYYYYNPLPYINQSGVLHMDNTNLPAHVQIYHPHGNYNWVSSERNQEDAFYFDKKTLTGGLFENIRNDNTQSWHLLVYRQS